MGENDYFANLERPTDGDTHWRIVTDGNRITLYGQTRSARITHPEDRKKVFE
ncbi:MAG: SpvB/TcaC N-terminal domain-containing protein [Acidobacteriota bacterium]